MTTLDKRRECTNVSNIVGSIPTLTAKHIMELSIKQTTALDLLEDTRTNEVLFGGGAG